MKVDFSVVLKTLEGVDLNEKAGPQTVRSALVEAGVSEQLLDRAMSILAPFFGTGDEPKETKLTLGRVAANALQAPDPSISGAERVDRMRLALKTIDVQPVEISEQEKEKILKAIEKTYPSPLVYFRAKEILEA